MTATTLERYKAIKDATDLREYVASDLGGHEQRRSRREYLQFLCPFHADGDPSLTVYEKGFVCHGCGERGDLADYLRLRLRRDMALLEVVKHFEPGSPTNHIVPKPPPKPAPPPSVGEDRLTATLDAVVAEAIMRFSGSDAENYCRSRGWRAHTRARYRLGYLPWSTGGEFCWSDDLAVRELGLLDENDYVWMAGRLIIPIRMYGRTVALACRSLPPQDRGTRYINSKRTPIFHRDEVLYGSSEVNFRERRLLFVAEGYADVWKLSDYGIPGVAIMGDRMTKWQADHIALLANADDIRIVLAFDGDMGGQGGWNEKLRRKDPGGEALAEEMLRERGVNPTRLRLEEGDVGDGTNENQVRMMMAIMEVMR